MNVFIIGTALETAMALDRKRLNKQIIECQQMIDAIEGKTTAWANHPCTLQYKNHKRWLMNYSACLLRYREGEIDRAKNSSEWCELHKPEFHTEEYFKQMKRRLYTKSPNLYEEWVYLEKKRGELVLCGWGVEILCKRKTS